MKNEEKAREIASTYSIFDGLTENKQYFIGALMEMAQWKDAQYAELLAKIAERNEESKMVARQISDNLKQMLKINNQ